MSPRSLPLQENRPASELAPGAPRRSAALAAVMRAEGPASPACERRARRPDELALQPRFPGRGSRACASSGCQGRSGSLQARLPFPLRPPFQIELSFQPELLNLASGALWLSRRLSLMQACGSISIAWPGRPRERDLGRGGGFAVNPPARSRHRPACWNDCATQRRNLSQAWAHASAARGSRRAPFSAQRRSERQRGRRGATWHGRCLRDRVTLDSELAAHGCEAGYA